MHSGRRVSVANLGRQRIRKHRVLIGNWWYADQPHIRIVAQALHKYEPKLAAWDQSNVGVSPLVAVPVTGPEQTSSPGSVPDEQAAVNTIARVILLRRTEISGWAA